jgi:hypothetical protein
VYIRLRSELIYLLLAAEQVEKREEARSFWHHITTTTPEANDGGCVKPQQPARHAPALEQDALRLSVESSFCCETEIDVNSWQLFTSAY